MLMKDFVGFFAYHFTLVSLVIEYLIPVHEDKELS